MKLFDRHSHEQQQQQNLAYLKIVKINIQSNQQQKIGVSTNENGNKIATLIIPIPQIQKNGVYLSSSLSSSYNDLCQTNLEKIRKIIIGENIRAPIYAAIRCFGFWFTPA